MQIYCVKCKQKTPTLNEQSIITKNKRYAIVGNCSVCNSKKYMFIKNELKGSNLFDIHKYIGKMPFRPKSGWTPGNYKYLGPYNPLERQVDFDENTGQIRKISQKLANRLDHIAMQHDICYTINPKNKGDCDRQMVKSIDEMPYKDMNKMAMLSRSIIIKNNNWV